MEEAGERPARCGGWISGPRGSRAAPELIASICHLAQVGFLWDVPICPGFHFPRPFILAYDVEAVSHFPPFLWKLPLPLG